MSSTRQKVSYQCFGLAITSAGNPHGQALQFQVSLDELFAYTKGNNTVLPGVTPIAPSLANLSTPSFPVIPLCPGNILVGKS
jgi:hypothetical protein